MFIKCFKPATTNLGKTHGVTYPAEKLVLGISSNLGQIINKHMKRNFIVLNNGFRNTKNTCTTPTQNHTTILEDTPQDTLLKDRLHKTPENIPLAR